MRKYHTKITMRNHNQQQKKPQIERNQQDYITTLPNSILCNILSSLSIREAVKTSVLSSKWRNLYTNPTNLILDAENILEELDYYSATTNICHLSEVVKFEIKMKRTFTFVTSVNQYLSHVKKVQKIDKLKVCFTFRNKGYGCNDLDEWIRFSMERNVEEIDLCLLEEDQLCLNAPSDGSLYVFPCDIIENGFNFKSFLKCMRLAHCVLAPQQKYSFNNSGFSTLTTLELFKVDLKSEAHIRILLSSCKSLEWLSFSECYNMENLKIEHPFCHKLKYLKVDLCCQLKGIVLQSNNMETFEYMGCKIDLFFDTPRLKSFFGRVNKSTTIHVENWPVFKLSSDLPQLETLFLEYNCMGDVMTNRFPTFPNLRHLEIIKVDIGRQDISWIPVALKACPTLTRLELHLRTCFSIDEDLRKTRWPPTCPLNHLKEVTITGLKGHSSEIAIAIYLLKNAIALEKMTVDPRQRIYLGNGKCGLLEEACENWSRVGRQRVRFQLEQEVSSLVELSIL